MDDTHRLIAYLSTLGSICILFIIASILLYNGKSVEAIGIGGVMTGLIGVLGTFRPETKSSGKTEITNTPDNPVPTEPQAQA